MIGFPFDSHVTYETDGTPVYDRAVTSAPLRKLIKSLFTSGVLPNSSTNMQVSADTGMNVIVHPGFAICNGCLKLEEASRTLAVQASNATYDRIDTVVLRLNDNDSERICDFYIKEGVPASSPIRAELTRSESVWELGLADLFIAKNSTAVSNQRITDTRYESARCGIVSSISEFDTTTLYQQVQADLEEFQNISEAEFAAWYDNIKGQLSEDAAGNLQNQIDAVNLVISDGYSTGKTYAVGDYCIYDNTLYRCINQITSAEPFDTAKWEATTLSDEIALVNRNSGVLLWENPNRFSPFTEQTITLASTDYDYLMIFYRSSASSTSRQLYTCLIKQDSSHMQYQATPGGTYMRISMRSLTDNGDGTVEVTAGSRCDIKTGSVTVVADDNTVCIPDKIYGCKFSR